MESACWTWVEPVVLKRPRLRPYTSRRNTTTRKHGAGSTHTSCVGKAGSASSAGTSPYSGCSHWAHCQEGRHTCVHARNSTNHHTLHIYQIPARTFPPTLASRSLFALRQMPNSCRRVVCKLWRISMPRRLGAHSLVRHSATVL